MAGLSASVRLSQIQGNIVPGFQKSNQAFILVRFPDRESGRTWLRALLPEIASAEEVFAFKYAFKTIQSRVAQPTTVIISRWANIALTFLGLQRIAATALQAFPLVFRSNRVPAARVEPKLSEADALLLLAADRSDDLSEDVRRHRDLFDAFGIRELREYRGQVLPSGRDHFGFKDGVSQPVVAGTPDADAAQQPPIPAGEFILGEVDVRGQNSVNGPLWARHGSYLAFLELQQHVAAFREATRAEAARLGISQDELQAWLVGRRQDGTPLSPAAPRPSHIGRAHPTWLAAEGARRRILRRGIPYGPPLGNDEIAGTERGLLFIAYQADLARQFQHVWAQWLNGLDFPLHGAGADGLVGYTEPGVSGSPGPRSVLIGRPGSKADGIKIRLPQFVSPRYGGYFFAPSLDGLAVLAGSD
jgi:Dyp-type peroxidase family